MFTKVQEYHWTRKTQYCNFVAHSFFGVQPLITINTVRNKHFKCHLQATNWSVSQSIWKLTNPCSSILVR